MMGAFFYAGIISLVFFGCARSAVKAPGSDPETEPVFLLEHAPHVGMRLEAGREPDGMFFLCHMNSTLHPAYRARHGGVDYLLVDTAFFRDGYVDCIATEDHGFVSPEGVRVGDSSEKARGASASGQEPFCLGECVHLESGWAACFDIPDGKSVRRFWKCGEMDER